VRFFCPHHHEARGETGPIGIFYVRFTMRRQSWSILSGVALGAALGFTIARGVDQRAVAKGALRPSPSSSIAAEPSDVPEDIEFDAWRTRFEAADWDHPDGGELGRLQHALAANAALRPRVVDMYRRERDPRVRSALRRMLTSDAAPDVTARALELAKAADKQDQAAGFELMTDLPPSFEARTLAKDALSKERDPAVLAAVLLALRPRVPPSPAEIDDMLPRFLALVHHDAPLVRAHAVQLLAEWDRAGRTAERVTAEALSDSAPLVRQAGVGAVMLGQIRSDRLKAALLDVVRNPTEDIQTRFGAQQALERFDVSREEYTLYMAARDDIERIASRMQR
jgi:hypothetical protein